MNAHASGNKITSRRSRRFSFRNKDFRIRFKKRGFKDFRIKRIILYNYLLYKMSPLGRHDHSDGGVNNLSVAVFKSKSAYSMRLLLTYLKDRKKNEIVWKITSKADFNSKDNINSDGGVNNLSAAVFKSKSAYSMRLLLTYLKDRKKNEIV